MSKLHQVYTLLILLSLKTTKTSTQDVPNYAKKGCRDMCGTVRIPYPFGIGAKCSLNKWYTVDCNSSTPYLYTPNKLQVLRVDLGSQIVTVNTPMISDCNQTNSLDLGGSPFFFSRLQNKFVFEGCGNAFMMDHGRSVIGCSTTCGNDSVNDMNNCLGIRCCQTTIPHHLQTYSLNLTGVVGDKACRSALLVDRDSYVKGTFSVAANNSYVPVSLLWTLLDGNFMQRNCCYTGSTIEVDLGNGTASVESFKCRSSEYSEVVGNIYLSDGCSWSSQASSRDKDPKCAKCREIGGYCNYGLVYDVDGLVTKMKFTSCYTSLLYDERKVSLRVILATIDTSTAAPKYAKEGCEHKCGDVRIPFPFGIGANCSMNKWYVVDCNSSTPYLHALNHLEILGVDLENQTVTVKTPVISDCSQTKSIDLGRSPFYFSKLQNIFVHEGCGNAVMTDHGRSITGCSTTCGNDSVSHTNNCLGMGCCQATLPHHLKSYNISITDGVSNRACKSAFLVDEASYLEGKFSIGENKSYVPISLLWTLAFSDLETLICYAFLDKLEVDLGNGTTVDSWKCRYSIPSNMEGNAYLIDGCESHFDSEECLRCKDAGGFCYNVPIYGVDGLVAEKKERCCSSWSKVKVDVGNDTLVESLKCLDIEYGKVDVNAYLADGFEEECAKCRDGTGGSCSYDLIYDVQGLVTRKVFSCVPGKSKVHESKSSQAVILGVSVSIGILILVTTIYLMHKEIKKTKERIQRKKNFKRNGGLLLKQQEESDPSLVDKTIHFTAHELEKATDHFNVNRILGRGGQGTVYKGMLVDGRIVAVKKSKIINERQLQQFINEVVILSQVNHRNVVKLLGCCLETEVPLLVSEFIPNGTLYDYIHKRTEEFPFSLNMRLQIATEVAGALAYLHSATSIPIYHRDIKTTNILLDEKYRAKVSDFGTLRSVSIDQTHLTTLVKGKFGYLDPEYFRSSQFTAKSDVYSFGVVLVELLTGEKPITQTRSNEHISLATHFRSSMEEGNVLPIFDSMVVKEGSKDVLLALANLAMRCLNMNGKYRPTMMEVASELETIRTSHIPSTD